MRLSDMRPLDIQKFYVGLTDKKLSPRTVRFTHSVLTSAFKQAVRWRLLAHNPCNAVELPRKGSAEMQSLTPAEAARFLKEAASDRWSTLFVLALATGLRPSEYLGLKWADVDLEQGVINVQRSLHWRSYKSGDWYFGEPKTPRSRRRIPLPVSVSRALIEHRRHQGEERLKLARNTRTLI
jgi:integrase